MALTGDIIPISSTVQAPSEPLPKIPYKETDFKNRKQYLNARSRAAGYKNYSQWLNARRQQGVPKKAKGGRKPKLYAFVLQDFRLAEGGVDEQGMNSISSGAVTLSEEVAMEGLKSEYDEFMDMSDEEKNRIYTVIFCEEYSRMTIDELKDYFYRSDTDYLLAATRKDYLLQTAFLVVATNECRNKDELIRQVERLSGKEFL